MIRHVEKVTGNVAMTCRYFGISRQAYYIWYRRYQAEGVEGLRTRSKRPKTSPNATHVEVVGKIIYLRQNYHFGGQTPYEATQAEDHDPSRKRSSSPAHHSERR